MAKTRHLLCVRCSGSGRPTTSSRTACGPSSARTIPSSPPSSRTSSACTSTRRAQLVLSVDEKSQIQALDRTQPGLPLKPGKAGTMTHDYLRNGITTLFAAFDVLEGTSSAAACKATPTPGVHPLPQRRRAHRAGRQGDPRDPRQLRQPQAPQGPGWLARHPRWVFHFTPTSGSWLNAVETFFSALTRRRLKRGSFHSLVDLQAAIHRYIAEQTMTPSPSPGPRHRAKSSPS